MTEILKDQTKLGYAEYHKDGLVDILLGLSAMLSGVIIFTDLVFMIGILPATLIPTWMAARKVTLKRLGVEELPVGQHKRSRLMILVGLFIGVLSFTALVGLYVALTFENLPAEVISWIGSNIIYVLGALIVGLLVISGMLSGIKRLYGYAALLVLSFLVGRLVGVGLPIILIVYGLIVSALGLWTFVRFTREYPKRS